MTFDFEVSFSALPSYTCKDTYCNKRLFYCCLCVLKIDSALLPMNMASKYHDDWQSNKKTVLQRNPYMFDNELTSDVSFQGRRKIDNLGGGNVHIFVFTDCKNN